MARRGRGGTHWLRERHRLDRRESRFAYTVVRVWQMSVDTLLAGGPGTLPLVPLGEVKRDRLAAVMRRIGDRLKREVPEAVAKKLWAATYVLMGLRYPEALAERLVQGVIAMEESVTYQAIIRKGVAQGRAEGREEGRVEEARELLLAVGRKRFGPPDATARAAVNAIADHDRLKELHLRLPDVGSWQELLAAP